ALRLLRDRAFQNAAAAQLSAGRLEGDELADVAGAAIARAGEGRQHPDDVLAPGPPRRLHSGPAAQRIDLDPGVLAQHPGLGIGEAPSERRLRSRVLRVRASLLRWVVIGR